jgi:nuclear transport factor 2 (NTF2) superfamily protein
MSGAIAEWIERYRVAWERRDPDAAAELFTPDATYRSNIVEQAHQGREGIRAYWQAATASQTEVKVRMGHPFVDGFRVAVEFWADMQVDGGPVTLTGCLLLDFNGEWLCQRLREYWHYLPGHHQPPEEWGQ